MRLQNLKKSNIKALSALCTDTFLEGEYSYYLQKCNLKGLDCFLEFCSVQNLTQKFDDKHTFIGCFDENTLVGVCGINTEISNILLLFVDKEYQKQGIGQKLIKEAETVLKSLGHKKVSVDSTHYAVSFYKKYGYVEQSKEVVLKDGLIYTPLTKNI